MQRAVSGHENDVDERERARPQQPNEERDREVQERRQDEIEEDERRAAAGALRKQIPSRV
jgi:hypothetical protein